MSSRLPPLTRHFHPVLLSKDLKRKPVQVFINSEAIVVFRDQNNQVGALVDRCPHRHTPLSLGKVVAEGLQCPYHGWCFDTEGQATIRAQPKIKCRAASYRAVERLGCIWVADRDTPLSALPEFIEPAENGTDGWEGYKHVGNVSALFHSPLEMVLDSFNDAEHIHIVHKVIGWAELEIDKIQWHRENLDNGSFLRAIGPQRKMPAPLNLLERILLPGNDTSSLEFGFRFSPVHWTFHTKWGTKGGEEPVFSVRGAGIIVPERENQTRVYNLVFFKCHSPKLKPLTPLLGKLSFRVSKQEIERDRVLLNKIGPVGVKIAGMRLGALDGQLVHNRKLLQKIYFGQQAVEEIA